MMLFVKQRHRLKMRFNGLIVIRALVSVHMFPIWALLVSLWAVASPAGFVDLKPYIIPLLMAVMLGMGMTLRWADFVAVWQRKSAVGLGVAIQFIVMPLAAFGLAKAFGLDNDLTIGLMLVGATAGGTASNVMAYLAKGDVALSVSMTLISTLLAVFLLPLLTWLYLGQSVQVPVGSMLWSLVKLILLPLLAGMALNHFFHARLAFLQPALPVFSMAAIVLIIGIVVGLNQTNLQSLAWGLAAVIVLHNAIGLASGYFAAKWAGHNEQTARTLAIEVGMQNSGLSVALALKYFSAAAALPGALFSIWHNVSGSVLAAYWRRK